MAKSSKVILQNTGERMIPEHHLGTLTYSEHMTRYLSAAPIVKGKIVLDIASGSGYGSNLLAKNAEHVYGVDVDAESIAYARENFGAKNLEFKVGDGESIPLEDNTVDIVITFETIEHIKDYRKFLKELKRVLKPDGLAIISTPNDLEFAEGNHFHLHEFKKNELLKLVKTDYKFVDEYYQATWKYVAIGGDQLFSIPQTSTIKTINQAPLTDDKFLYFYFVCSNRKITEKIEPLAALGAHYSDRTNIARDIEMRTAINGYKKVVEEKNGMIESLQSEKLQLKAKSVELQRQITELQASTSWKVTAPLRKAKIATERIKHSPKV